MFTLCMWAREYSALVGAHFVVLFWYFNKYPHYLPAIFETSGKINILCTWEEHKETSVRETLILGTALSPAEVMSCAFAVEVYWLARKDSTYGPIGSPGLQAQPRPHSSSSGRKLAC